LKLKRKSWKWKMLKGEYEGMGGRREELGWLVE